MVGGYARRDVSTREKIPFAVIGTTTIDVYLLTNNTLKLIQYAIHSSLMSWDWNLHLNKFWNKVHHILYVMIYWKWLPYSFW